LLGCNWRNQLSALRAASAVAGRLAVCSERQASQVASAAPQVAIMAYNCSPSCIRVNYWSNPNVNYSGLPTGVTGMADNRAVLNNTRVTAANWRMSVVP
jgi:hypothetical protein